MEGALEVLTANIATLQLELCKEAVLIVGDKKIVFLAEDYETPKEEMALFISRYGPIVRKKKNKEIEKIRAVL